MNNEELIEEAAKVIYDDDPDWGYVYEDEHGEYAASWFYLPQHLREKFREMAVRAGAVFEKSNNANGQVTEESELRDSLIESIKDWANDRGGWTSTAERDYIEGFEDAQEIVRGLIKSHTEEYLSQEN